MAGTAGNRFDPRYDARFQRGYEPPVGGVAEEVVATTPVAAVRGAAVPPDAGPRVAAPAVGGHDDRDAFTELFRGLGVEPISAGTAMPPTMPADGTAVSAVSAVWSAAPHGGAEADAPPMPVAGTAPTAWLWVVIGGGVLFIAVGLIATWNVAYEMHGQMDTEAMAARQIVMAFGPAAVQVGVLGLVAALLVWALFGRRRQAGR
ncbi:hypothetical protein [Agromyces sp. LHK192]|uniref:hypothetical protein n=1 Tax=Agromyces sp. LHK192 TaxID=2498704 RepID=UPI000FD773A3|nr:hypothetical protein [Agromyces sp. LHK192]